MVATTSQARAGLAGLSKLPAFSPVAAKLIVQLRLRNTNFQLQADVIKTDAGLSAELLRMANSASTASRFPVANIFQALSLLGADRVASLITTLCVGKLLKPVSTLPVMRQCWRSNLATALIARQWADRFDIEPETAYLIGLLSDIGRLALLVIQPAVYTQLVEQSLAEQVNLDILEQQRFGFNSRQASSWLVTAWRLPNELIAVLDPGNTSRIALLIRSGADEAARLGFGVPAAADFNPTNTEAFELGKQLNQIEQDLAI